MCRTVWNHVTLVQSLVRRYPCEPFDAHQVLSCPAGLINFWKIIRFAGTWRLAWSLTIPQAEATICHCNFMLIERRELFKMSFSPPFLLFLTVPLSSLSFIIFFIFTPRSLNLVHTQSEILLLLSSTMAFVFDKSAVTKTRCREDPWRNTEDSWRNNSLQALMYVKKHNVLRLVPQETDVLPGGQVPNNTA